MDAVRLSSTSTTRSSPMALTPRYGWTSCSCAFTTWGSAAIWKRSSSFSTGFLPGGGTDLVYLVMAFELLSLRIFLFLRECFK